MDFDDLIKEVGFYAAVHIKWINGTFDMKYFDNYPLDDLWRFYTYEGFDQNLRKLIKEKIDLIEMDFNGWKEYLISIEKKYTSNFEQKTPILQHIVLHMKQTASTFDDWYEFKRVTYNYTDNETRIYALQKMLELAGTLGELSLTHDHSLGSPGIQISQIAFQKMCKLERKSATESEKLVKENAIKSEEQQKNAVIIFMVIIGLILLGVLAVCSKL